MTSAGVVWIDAHCHLQFEERAGRDDDSIRPRTADETAAELVARADDAGVERMVCIGTDLATSAEAVRLAGVFPEVWAAVGLHPHDASKLADEWGGLVELAGADRVVAIGEAGFDLYYRHSEPDAQDAAFRAQVRLAKDLGLPLVIHSRDAWPETFGALESEGVPPRTVFHCFTGGPAEAQRALAMGCWLSYSGIVSFKTADDLRAAAAVTPADRLLIETDAPFLAPVPHRGKPNEPALLPAVGAALAAARNEPVQAVAATTRANALAFFWP
ncbi:MAG TPA: TatD family hydrolase [Acidimicrobiia bacterium]|nr:TatD family hydrolase [Acidimicrobiia bacterium]